MFLNSVYSLSIHNTLQQKTETFMVRMSKEQRPLSNRLEPKGVYPHLPHEKEHRKGEFKNLTIIFAQVLCNRCRKKFLPPLTPDMKPTSKKLEKGRSGQSCYTVQGK